MSPRNGFFCARVFVRGVGVFTIRWRGHWGAVQNPRRNRAHGAYVIPFYRGLSLFPPFVGVYPHFPTGSVPIPFLLNRGLSLLWGLSLFPFRGLSPFPAPLSLPRSSAPGASLFCMGGRRAAPLPGLFPAHVAFPRLLPLRVRIKKRRPESLRSFPASPPSRQ